MLDKQSISWLKENKHKLPPEELLFIEEERYYKIDFEKNVNDGRWLIPEIAFAVDGFYNIETHKEFNETIQNRENWEFILSNKILYYKWILPNAVLLFGKTWLNKDRGISRKKNCNSA